MLSRSQNKSGIPGIICPLAKFGYPLRLSMTNDNNRRKYLRRHVALPGDHGSWVFLFSPLLIGLFAGGRWRVASAYLILGCLAVFLVRHPITLAVKMFSGRRGKQDMPAVGFWMVVYGIVGLMALAGLISTGYSYLLYLAVPGVLVFGWNLYLVSVRSERHQMGVDIVASGALALAAPAAYWVGLGEYEPIDGWLLWLLVWFQSAASIVYAFLRLGQRGLKEVPEVRERVRMAWRALLYCTFNLVAVLVLGLMDVVPLLLSVPFAIQWVECIWGTMRPAVGFKPVRIGMRQLLVSVLFTVFFIATWG